ncbi:MAG: HlyD family efflux transporter periplasmic adaptor subunit [Hyphomicrobiaceae bacterium]
MSHFLEELVRGTMVDAEDTIQRIDVPVTPASLEPDKPLSQRHNVPARRWPLKLIVMSSLYAIVGMMILGYTAFLLYSNFYRLEVRTAVISAPVETIVASTDGRLDLAAVKAGDPVRAGDVVVRLVDSQLQREIEMAEIAVRERRARLSALKERHIEELDRIRNYATVEMKNIRQTKLEIEALKEQLDLAERQENRLIKLRGLGYTTADKLEDASRRVIALRKDLDVRRVELNARVELSRQNVGKRLYSGNETIGQGDIIGKSAEVESEIRMAEHEVQLAQQRRVAWLKHRDRLAIKAPFDGIVLDLPRQSSANIRRGDVLAVIEQRKSRQVTAYLNQDEVMRVGRGDEATIFIPALGETLSARVLSIDRTRGFVDEQNRASNPSYRWRGPTDRTAKVTLAFADPKRVADAERYRSGLPVVVLFQQRATNPLFASLSSDASAR